MKPHVLVVCFWMVAFQNAFDAPPTELAEAYAPGSDRTANRPCDESCSCAFELTPPMKTWVRRAIPAAARLEPKHRLRRLFEMLLRRDGLALRQKGGHTPSAPEAFHSRQANCAAFAFLLVALARDVGVPAYFVFTRDDVRSTRYGKTQLAERHLAAAYGPLSNPTVVDFGGFADGRGNEFVFISDETAGSIFCSNRGAEELVAGRTDSALRWLQTAVRIDSTLDASWLNLGVALRMTGDFDGAERAYLRALHLNPEFVAARNNLAYLNHVRNRFLSEDDAGR